MIDPAIEHRIRELLASGRHSQRAIARMTGIARGTVASIASGDRPDYSARQQAKIGREKPPFSGPARRCGTCGAKVQLPCLACSIARDQAAGRLQRSYTLPDPEKFELQLRHAERARYLRIQGRHVLPEEGPAEEDGITGSTG